MKEAIDRFLSLSLRCAARKDAPPPWPQAWPDDAGFHETVFARVAFHGVALALLAAPSALSDWPATVSARVREEARGQSFWELGHRTTAAHTISTLAAAGASAAVTKGTALAYSVYTDPAMRRRGDTDLLLGPVSRKAVRRALAAAGFHRIGDARPLQETWGTTCAMGFTHAFDLHWRISASAMIAQRLEQGGIGTRSVPLPRLCDGARAIHPADNLVLIAVNRALHHKYGYQSGETKSFDQDRLIWAIDLARLCGAFTSADWDRLLVTATASGTAPLVLSSLDFMEQVTDAAVPPDWRAALANAPGDATLLAAIDPQLTIRRLKFDLAASPAWGDKLRILSYALLPGAELLHERFPESAHWPVPLLQGRRLLSGVGSLFAGRP